MPEPRSTPVTVPVVRAAKRRDGHLPLVMVTAYDAPGARIADAAGVDAVVCCDGTVDPTNPKSIRASAGSLFHLPVVAGGEAGVVLRELREWGFTTVGTVVRGGVDYAVFDWNRRVAMVFGNEASGLGDSVAGGLDAAVSIPMAGRAESLNVSVSAAVLCFEALRRRRAGGDRDRRAETRAERGHDVARFVADVHAGVGKYRRLERGLFEALRLVERAQRRRGLRDDLVEVRGEPDHRELLDQPLRIARAAGNDAGRIAAPFEFGQGVLHVRQHLEPLGLVDFSQEVCVRQLRVLGPEMLRHSQPYVVGGKCLAIALMGERRIVAEFVERAFRGDIQRPVDIDQRAVEIEKDRLEFARCQQNSSSFPTGVCRDAQQAVKRGR